MSKQRAKCNAEKHGIFSKILLSMDAFSQDRERILDLISAFRESLQPATGFEDALVAKLAFLFFRLARVYAADSKIAPKLFARVSELLKPGHPAVQSRWLSSEDEAIVVRRDPTHDSIVRYESNLERQIKRTLDELESSKRIRISKEVVVQPEPEGGSGE